MTLDEKFGEGLLQRIEEKKIKPLARWRFLLKDCVVWGMGSLSLVLGGLSMLLVFYMLSHNNPDSYEMSIGKVWDKFFLIVPTFWIACLAVFIFIIFYNIKHTKKGYRYSVMSVLLFTVLASALLGGIFYVFGLGDAVNVVLGKKAPFYDRLMNPRIDFWSKPKEGRLTGVIDSEMDDGYIVFDRGGKEWRVITTKARKKQCVNIGVGRSARFLGEMQGNDEFVALEILPAIASGDGFFDRFGRPHEKRGQFQEGCPVK